MGVEGDPPAAVTQDFRFRSSTVRENWMLPIAMSQVRQGFELRLSGAIEILVPFRSLHTNGGPFKWPATLLKGGEFQ